MKAQASISRDRSKIVLDGENQLRHFVRKELAFKTTAQSN
jgi:hypothetical protein